MRLPRDRNDHRIVKAQLVGVDKTFENDGRSVQALSGLSLEVFKNEILCIVGPSGCGKTTAINVLAGFTSPTSGHCLLNGERIAGISPHCGVVFQQESVFPWMCVSKNIAYGLRFNGTPKGERDAIVQRYLTLVGLSDFAHSWPRDLSGGMRKRVDLARAYAANPELLLLDEPFGQLDVLTREEMQTLLLDVWACENKTMLCVTHDPEEAIFLGQRVAVMSPRPGAIVDTFPIPFPMPRDPALKCSPEFQELRRELLSALNRARHNSKAPRTFPCD